MEISWPLTPNFFYRESDFSVAPTLPPQPVSKNIRKTFPTKFQEGGFQTTKRLGISEKKRRIPGMF